MRRAILFYGGLLLVVAAMAGYAYALSVQSAWELSGRQRFKGDGEFIRASGNRRLRANCIGVGQPGILLEATGVGGADQYGPLVQLLGRYSRVCAYDRAGMGYSDPRPGDAKLSDYTEDLEVIASEKLGPPPWILVGGSYGGVVVQAYARMHPDNVGALLLLDAVVPEAFEVMQAPWASLDSSLRKAELLAPVGLLRMKDPLQLGDTKEGWQLYRTSTWTAVRRLVSTREEARGFFRTAAPLPADLPLTVMVHTKVGDMMGPDFSMEESQKLEPAWQKAQRDFAATSTKGKLVAVEGAGHVIVKDALEQVKDEVVTLMHPAAQRGMALAGARPGDAGTAADGGVATDAGTADSHAGHGH
jgi:pimeloyl-ACP methyl ester carboxylesterase